MIYADANASEPLLDQVRKYITKRLYSVNFANPGALHAIGRKLHKSVIKSREICARVLHADNENIFFNSGASEGIAQVFCMLCAHTKKSRIAISAIEHDAVFNTASQYQKYGLIIDVLPATPDGILNMPEFKNYIDKYNSELALVSVMAANNETGVIQPFSEIAEICRHYSVPYFCDTTQLIGKADFNFKASGLDYAVMSGHKTGALPGTGILVLRNPEYAHALIPGAAQENGLRGGTENYLGIETLALSLEVFEQKMSIIPEALKCRLDFEKKLKDSIPEIFIAGEKSQRLWNTSFASYPGILGQAVQIELESMGVLVTTSSACKDNEPGTSRVLKAMNISEEIARGMIRISMSLNDHLVPDYLKIHESLLKAFKKLARIL